MLLGVDPLEGVLDTKLLVHILELFAADQFPCATVGGLEAVVAHAVVVEDDLHAAAATDDLVCLIERLLESDTLELDGIMACVFPFLVVDKIILPGNYLKVHSYFQINQKSFR